MAKVAGLDEGVAAQENAAGMTRRREVGASR
jgi:hypothetical protein